MKHSIDFPAMTISYDVVAKGEGELTESDIVYSELHAAVVALSSVIAQRHNTTEKDIFEHLVEIGKSAQDSLQELKG